MVVDDDFDEGPLPDADGSGCDEEGAPPQTAAAAPADEQPAAAGKSKAAAACVLCGQAAKVRWIECGCGARTHVECLGEHYLQVPRALPLCCFRVSWSISGNHLQTPWKNNGFAHVPMVFCDRHKLHACSGHGNFLTALMSSNPQLWECSIRTGLPVEGVL